MPLVTAY